MRICIFGAGASGGHFAVRLARAGHDVSVIARGPHLAAIREGGLRLKTGSELLSAQVAASDTPNDLGPQDLVIVATKATALPAIAPHIAPLVGKDTLVLFPQNGMTWWYPVGLPSAASAAAGNPDLRTGQAVSCGDAAGPGAWRHHLLGERGRGAGCDQEQFAHSQPAGICRDRRERAACRVRDPKEVLEHAGILSPDPGDIRAALWTKLVNNMSGSTLGLATRSTSDGARKDAALSEIYCRVMSEGLSIAAAHGYRLDIDPERMLSRLLNHKASLLQDYEQGRPMEIAEIVLAPVAFARAAKLATPTLDTIAAIVTKLARDRELLPAGIVGPSLAPAEKT